MQLVASRCAAGPMPRSTQRSHSPLIRPGGGWPSGYIPTKRGRRLHSWCGSPSQHTRAQQRPALIEQDAEQLSATHPVQLSAVTRHSDTQERGARRCECPNVPDFPAARLWRRHAPQPCTGPLNVHRSTVSLPLAVVGGRPTAPWHGRPSVTLASSLVATP